MSKQKEDIFRTFSVSDRITENINTPGTRFSTYLPEDRVLFNPSDTEKGLLSAHRIGEHYSFIMRLRSFRDGLRCVFDLEVFKSIENIASSDTDAIISYRSDYYFPFKNDQIIITRPSDRTIKQLQTYLNCLVESELDKTPLEFIPSVSENIQTQTLGSITSIKIGASKLPGQDREEQEGVLSRVLYFAVDMLKEVFQENVELHEVIDKHLVLVNLDIAIQK